jgi:hypothetical protein
VPVEKSMTSETPSFEMWAKAGTLNLLPLLTKGNSIAPNLRLKKQKTALKATEVISLLGKVSKTWRFSHYPLQIE